MDVKFVVPSRSGKSFVKTPGRINVTPSAIEFIKSPFALKDEIKAMKGARWHGFEDPPRKIWTVNNCQRNWFNMELLMGGNPYVHFDQPLREHSYDRPLFTHQKHLADAGLTYHYQIWGAEMGTGKTLSAIEVIEKSNKDYWWWVGPKSGLYAIEREFKKWGIDPAINMELMTYEGLVKRMRTWDRSEPVPYGIIFDESSRLKTPTTLRTQAAMAIADGIRAEYEKDGYVILMTGTPSPKSPLDWWAQAEVAWPGYLKEGTIQAFKMRMGLFTKRENDTGQSFMSHVTWRDDARKCNVCGKYEHDTEIDGEIVEGGSHTVPGMSPVMDSLDPDMHDFVPSTNEVEYLHERLKGLVVVKHKKDCLDLPDKRYRIVECDAAPSTVRVAQALVKSAPNTITGLCWLPELSDGFQYRQKKTGMQTCPVCQGEGVQEYWVDPEDSERAFTMTDMFDDAYVATLEKQKLPCASCSGTGEVDKYEREVKEIPCPKETALCDLLDENEECGRVVIFAGFTGSIDRVTGVCLKAGWDVVRVDGRGWNVYTSDGQVRAEPLDYWADMENNAKVAFVAHPKSGGMALTLTEARMAIYYSNDYSSESRIQSEDRIHRPGMDLNLGATVVDLVHLPTDKEVLNILKENRRLELMSMGRFEACLETADV
jgi:SNF2 family DNA or RNA helicase